MLRSKNIFLTQSFCWGLSSHVFIIEKFMVGPRLFEYNTTTTTEHASILLLGHLLVQVLEV